MKKFYKGVICLSLLCLGVYKLVVDDINEKKAVKEQKWESVDQAVRDYAKYAREKYAVMETIDTILEVEPKIAQ